MIEDSLPQRLLALETRIRELEHNADESERERTRALLQTVLELHGAGLARLLELLGQAGTPGRDILQRAGQDELIRNLLLLHGLHTQDLESRVTEALDQVRPFLQSQGAKVHLDAIAEDAVRLWLEREGRYPAAIQTLRAAIEDAIYALAPDVNRIEFLEASPSRHPLPMVSGRPS
jgi:hypothetical protein